MKFTRKDLTVYYKGKARVFLNPDLIEEQGITSIETIEELKITHEDRLRIFEAMENTDDPEELKMFAKQFETIEFEQQKLWGFKLDRNFHKWFTVPKCTCPKMDNEDRCGTEYKVINPSCPVHNY